MVLTQTSETSHCVEQVRSGGALKGLSSSVTSLGDDSQQQCSVPPWWCSHQSQVYTPVMALEQASASRCVYRAL